MNLKVNEKLVKWILDKIESEYKNEVSLVLSHNTLLLEKDMEGPAVSFYIPASERAYGLAKTFIIDGIGYDFYPISWERMEEFAELNEYNTSSLMDADIIFSRSEEDKKRFGELQEKLKKRLQDEKFMMNKALEKLNIAMDIYRNMLFEDKLSQLRKAAGYVADYLSIAVACVNHTFFKNGQTNQIQDLKAMESVPNNFIIMYEAIVRAASKEEIKQLCYEMINSTRQFLSSKKEKGQNMNTNSNFQQLAGWYEELCYTWRRVYHWCDEKDVNRAYIWGCYLQYQLDIVKAEFGLEEMDLLGEFNADNLQAYRERAELLEKHIVSMIESKGAVINTYAAVEEFLQKNK